MTRFRRAGGSLIVAALLVAACSKQESAGRTDSSAMGPATTNTPAMAGGAAQPAAAAAPALTDASIAYILDQANISDSTRGRLAETKGTSADVKAFGKLMAGEHHALHAATLQLEQKLNVTPQAPAGDQSQAQAKQEMDSLTAMPKGPAWDKSYIDFEVGYHKAVLETATAALGATQNAELKALIQKAAPVVQHHLDRALAIQKKQGG